MKIQTKSIIKMKKRNSTNPSAQLSSEILHRQRGQELQLDSQEEIQPAW